VPQQKKLFDVASDGFPAIREVRRKIREGCGPCAEGDRTIPGATRATRGMHECSEGIQGVLSGRIRMEVSVFHRKTFGDQTRVPKIPSKPFPYFFIETLEDRQLLSASPAHHHSLHAHKTTSTARHASKHHSSSSSTSTKTTASIVTSDNSSATSDPTKYGGFGRQIDSIAFDLTPTAVQSGLTSLAGTDGLTAPTSTQLVHLGNSNGVETYSLDYTTTGTQSRITVDENGHPVTAPTTITWADLSGTGASSDAAAAAEITTIATALSLTAPTDTTVVNVSTTASGSVYSVRLSSSSSTSTSTEYDPGRTITVDSNGNPVGNQNIPFSTLPSTIQGYINANLPTGATALDPTSTQTVNVRTIDGVATYATRFTTTGTTSTVTVDLAGDVVTPTAPTTETFSAIPQLAQTELQALATAEGVTATIATTQTVKVFAELNGTTVYSVTLSDTDSTTSDTYNITVSSDQLGDPTVPPGFGGGFAGAGFGGFQSPGFGGGDGGMGGGDCSGG
jgi:hypothetical protein